MRLLNCQDVMRTVNRVVGLVRPKAMPVLTNAEEWRPWLEAPAHEALALQRPLADNDNKEVTRGARSDG